MYSRVATLCFHDANRTLIDGLPRPSKLFASLSCSSPQALPNLARLWLTLPSPTPSCTPHPAREGSYLRTQDAVHTRRVIYASLERTRPNLGGTSYPSGRLTVTRLEPAPYLIQHDQRGLTLGMHFRGRERAPPCHPQRLVPEPLSYRSEASSQRVPCSRVQAQVQHLVPRVCRRRV